MVVSLKMDEAPMLRRQQAQSERPAPSPAEVVPASKASDDDVTLDMCSLTDQYSPREKIAGIADPVAISIAGWRALCPPRWSVAGILISTMWVSPTAAQFAKERIVDVIFLLLIAVQWLLVGGFPLRPHRGLWGDPATHITACTVAAGALSLVPNIESFCTLPMLYAFTAWFWWLSLLIRSGARSGLNWIAARRLIIRSG
jgi:hypothetical protein